MRLKIQEDHLKEWYNTLHTKRISEGWEIYKLYNKDYNAVKVRRKYLPNETAFNEDGYMYDMLFPEVGKTKDYLFLISKGYKIDLH